MSNVEPTIIGIAGSLRKGSFNAALLRAASEFVPSGVSLAPVSIREIPIYDGDLEARAFPEPVTALKERIASAAGLLIVTPEYNSSIPGVLKNTIDWLSRPSSDLGRVFGGKPVAVTGASPGRLGTVLSQTAWLPVIRALGAELWPGPRLLVSEAHKAFDEQGRLTDERLRQSLEKFVQGFAEWCVSR